MPGYDLTTSGTGLWWGRMTAVTIKAVRTISPAPTALSTSDAPEEADCHPIPLGLGLCHVQLGRQAGHLEVWHTLSSVPLCLGPRRRRLQDPEGSMAEP